jgi:hypothetical protein
MEQLDVWSLIQAGLFEEACKKADVEYEVTKDVFLLRNKVYALLHSEKYQECILVTHKIIDLRNGETDSDFVFCGIANWLVGNKAEAVQQWHNGKNCKYTDAAGGVELQVILYFASISMADETLKSGVVKTLKKLLKSKRSISWPGPLGQYILGEITEEVLFANTSNIPILKERQLCQANFAVAIKELEKGNTIEYKKKLQESIGYGSPSYLEQVFYLAKGELKLSYMINN